LSACCSGLFFMFQFWWKPARSASRWNTCPVNAKPLITLLHTIHRRNAAGRGGYGWTRRRSSDDFILPIRLLHIGFILRFLVVHQMLAKPAG